jgi:hypothetical protein
MYVRLCVYTYMYVAYNMFVCYYMYLVKHL